MIALPEGGRELDCIAPPDAASLPVFAVRPSTLPGLLESLSAASRAFLAASGFSAAPGEVALLPGEAGIEGAVLGLGEGTDPMTFGALPYALPAGTAWRLAGEVEDPVQAALAFLLGAYRFNLLRAAPGRSRPGWCCRRAPERWRILRVQYG